MTQTSPVYSFTAEELDAVVAYLTKQSFAEVADLMPTVSAMQNSPENVSEDNLNKVLSFLGSRRYTDVAQLISNLANAIRRNQASNAGGEANPAAEQPAS